MRHFQTLGGASEGVQIADSTEWARLALILCHAQFVRVRSCPGVGVRALSLTRFRAIDGDFPGVEAQNLEV